VNDIWVKFRLATQARIGLGRNGHAISTKDLLQFQQAHAAARDAVQSEWDALKFSGLLLKSQAHTRESYLKNPGLGRKLSEESVKLLEEKAKDSRTDLVFILTDGLSAKAVDAHFEKFWAVLQERLKASGFAPSPLVLVPFGRVAISDDVGAASGAKLAVMFVGERPGLSASDSLGIYLTYDPKSGNSDANRNCISNVRPPNGLGYEDASEKLMFLIQESLRRKLSGVDLKESANLPSLIREKTV
jgi:ethanolamine ammonia-lyase small subunit